MASRRPYLPALVRLARMQRFKTSLPPFEASFSGSVAAHAANAIDRSVKVVRDEQRSILHRQDIDGTPDIVVVLNETSDEGFHRPECAISVQLDDHHITTDLDAAIPRPVSGEEDHVAIFVSKVAAGVEFEPERG